MNGNWVDLIIIIFLIFFAFEARKAGFWAILVDFISFLVSLIVGLRIYPNLSELLKNNFSLTRSVANAVSFLLIAILIEAILGLLLSKLIKRFPEKILKHRFLRHAYIIPAIGEAFILIAFILTLTISFPVSPKIKSDISASRIGGFLVRETSDLEARLSEIFGGVVEDSLTHLIVKPESRESIFLTVESEKLIVDEKAEGEMFALINEERKKQGLSELTYRPEVAAVARAHAKDIWEKRYFGHISPEGKDVGDRLMRANLLYFVAGENLALAPTTSIAHTGLMNSDGHRANILSIEFSRVGIGVIDNGYYGKMFVQVFTD